MTTYGKMYYECNRDKLLPKMRERYQKEKVIRDEFLENHPEAIEDFRIQWREKYYTTRANTNRKLIEEWIEMSDMSDLNKTFLRESVLKQKTFEEMTPTTMKTLWNIVRPRVAENIPSIE